MMKSYILLFTFSFLLLFGGKAQTDDQQHASNSELPPMSLAAAGFNQDSIDNLINRIYATHYKDFRGMVVLKDNQLVIEEYFNTFWRISILDIRSAGKSITALLLGIAMQEGLIESLDKSVYSLFSPEKNPSINEDYKKITLNHLLDMSSGLDADSDDPETPGQAGNWMSKDDWKSYLLNIPLVSKPGKRWVYADIHAVLIGLAIEEASGMSLRDYAQQKLFDPLGIKQVYWYTNAAKQTGGAGNLYLSTYDFAKLGLMLTNEGKWAGKQLIAPSYIQELIQRQNFDLSPIADTYGMLWYKETDTVGDQEIDFVYASGNGGNYLIVLPDHDMVIALTSSAYGPIHGHGRARAILRKLFEAME